MTSPRQAAANRANAKRSTGPRSEEGKAAVRFNALKHGLRSPGPVVTGEDAVEWEEFRAGVVQSLAPASPLESDLAARAAMLAWRLRRVAAYEAGVTSTGIRNAVARVDENQEFKQRIAGILGEPPRRTLAQVEAEIVGVRATAAEAATLRSALAELREMPDASRTAGYDLLEHLAASSLNSEPTGAFDLDDQQFLKAVGVPAEWHGEAQYWPGWTAGMVRAGAKIVAAADHITADELLAHGERVADELVASTTGRLERLEIEAAALVETAAAEAESARARSLLAVDVLPTVERHETHLTRQLAQALALLRDLQAARPAAPTTSTPE